jgi:hypothetical protein
MTHATKNQNFADMKISDVQIVHGARGFPIGNNAAQGHTKPTGMFMSRKCGFAMPWVSFHELHLMWISECDTAVGRFLSQPIRLELYVRHRAKPILYFPDIERQLDGGIVEVIEVKKTKEEVDRDPFYAFKIEKAKEAFRAAEIRFRILTAEDHIGVEPRLGNAKTIMLDRFTRLETADIIRLQEAMGGARGCIAYGKAIEALSDRGDPRDPDARAKLHASVVMRLASIDLSRRIILDSPVTEVKSVRRQQKAA